VQISLLQRYFTLAEFVTPKKRVATVTATMWQVLLTAHLARMIGVTSGEKVSGRVNVADSEGFAFLGKFCFQDIKTDNFTYNLHHGPAAGTVDVELTNTGHHGSDSYVLVMYDDQDNSWPQIYDTGLTCEQKTKGNYDRLQRTLILDADDTVDRDIGVHQHIRPRWWWLYLANCAAYNNSAERANLTTIAYSLHFKQTTDAWLKVEVGSNEQGLSIMYSVYLALYVLLFAVQLYAYYVYTIQQYIHQVIKLLTATIGLQLFSVAFNFADWIIFTETGQHEIFFPIIASLCEILAATVFLLLLLVLAQGWTVSRFEVSYPKTILAACCVVAIVQCVLYIWLLIGLDEQTTTFKYNTVPQYVYGALFIVIGLFYLFECIKSYRAEPLSSKKHLYIALAAFFSIWFFWPLLRILVGDAFSPWTRDVAINSISLTINTIIYFIMMLLMYPTWAHQYFNLSMVDTQERILNASANDDSSGTRGAKKNNKSDYQVLEQDRL